ncbi:MAG: SH3 domain-containing protein [Chitinophagaceae bacterium]|nr:MAG: SH3 domain-containing protein [Chitinophagaceae bacterium]
MQKIGGLTFLLSLFSLLVSAQENSLYVAAKTGLNMREKPDPAARVIVKIPYGTGVMIQYAGEESKRVEVEGLLGYWKKVIYNNQAGYIIDAYLLPLPPPVNTVKSMKEYFRQVSTAFGDSLMVSYGSPDHAEDGGSQLVKQLYKNGSEWQAFTGYEYNSMTYFLPHFTMQQAFLLIRLIPEFAQYIDEKDPFVISNKKIKKNGREYEYKVEKEFFGNTPWIERIKIAFEEGAMYNFEMFQMDNQIVIFYGAGV